jgi:hypothetical protein
MLESSLRLPDDRNGETGDVPSALWVHTDR